MIMWLLLYIHVIECIMHMIDEASIASVKPMAANHL